MESSKGGANFSLGQNLALLLLVLIFIFKLYLVIWQFVDNNFLIAPGGDPVNHLSIVEQILSGKLNDFTYPPFYHYIIAEIVKITGCDPLIIMKYSAIILLFIAVPFFYVLVESLFGFWAAFFATLLYMLVSSNPLLGFVDGNYPDMLNYGVFIPLVFILMLKAVYDKPITYSLISLPFIVLMVFTHHLTSFFTIAVTILFLATGGAFCYFTKDKKGFRNFATVGLVYLVFSLVLYILIRITYGEFLMSSINTVISGKAPIKNAAFANPIAYANLSSLLSPALEFLGLVGVIYALATINTKRNEKLLLLIWIVVLWGLSRTSLSGLAPRYLREISVPLAITAGLVLAELFKGMNKDMNKIFSGGILGYVIFMNLIQLNVPPFMLPEGFKNMVWFRQVDQEKIDYFENNLPKDAKIINALPNPYLTYFLNKTNTKNLNLIKISNVPGLDKAQNTAEKEEIVDNFLTGFGAAYLFINTPPVAGGDEDSFGVFAGNKRINSFISVYRYEKKDILKQFSDGSKLILLKSN